MANGADLILRGVQPAIAAATPVTTFQQGQQASNLLQQQALRNQLLGQQIAQAPLQQQLLEQRRDIGALDIATKQAVLDDLGVPDEPTAQQLAFNVAKLKELGTPELKLQEISRMKADAIKAGRTTTNLDELEAAFQQNPVLGEQLLDAGIEAFRQVGALRPDQESAAASAGQREFESLISDFTPEEQEQARRVKAGIAPRAVGTGAITTAITEGLTEKVAESGELIKQREEFGKKTGASRAKAIDSGFERIQKIDGNIRNIDRAVKAIDDGASTGAIESRFFPSFRRATKELEQVQKELGLDVIGSVTFGALSEGELNLALETALPTGLEPQPLREHLINKREAQEKLRSYYQDQIDFLDQGGTIAGFLRSRERGAQPEQQNTFTSSTGIQFTVE